MHVFQPRDLDDVEAFHRGLMQEGDGERAQRIERGRAWLRAQHNPEDEARRLVELWASITSGS